MKKIILVILLIAVAFGSFAKTAKAKKKKQLAPTTIMSVGMHRTVCYGKCPDYVVDIAADGTATYTAKRFTPEIGIFKKNIGKAKAEELIGMFTKYRVDTCSEMYENRIPDLPGLNIYIRYPNKTKTIYSAGFGPEFLTEIGEALDAAGRKPEGKDKTWKKTGMPKVD